MEDFDEYHYRLGPPLAAATKTGDVYTRQFKHATVKVDLKQRKSTISWGLPRNSTNIRLMAKIFNEEFSVLIPSIDPHKNTTDIRPPEADKSYSYKLMIQVDGETLESNIVSCSTPPLL